MVLNELWMGLDNPEDVLYTRTMSALYVSGLYHHPVIGWQEDVESTTRERMMKYYLKHYTPDRATIVVVGGADRDRTIAKVGELFGPIPRGETVRFEAKEQKILGETRLTLLQDTQVPRIQMAWRSMPILDPDEPLLDVFSSIVSGDKMSRLDKALVETGIAATVSAFSDCLRDDGSFVVQAQPAGEHTLDEVEAGVKKVLAELLAKGITAEELARAKAKILADRVFGGESSMGLAERLGSVAVVGDWRYDLRYPAKIEAATPESVMAAAKRVIDLDRLVVGRSLPKPPAAKASDEKPAGTEAPAAGGASGGGMSGGGGGAAHRAAPSVGVKGARNARFRDPTEGAGATRRDRQGADARARAQGARRTGSPCSCSSARWRRCSRPRSRSSTAGSARPCPASTR